MPSEQIFPETNRWVCLNLARNVFWMFKIWQCLDTWQPGTDFSRLNTPQSEIYKDIDGKAYSNVQKAEWMFVQNCQAIQKGISVL